MKNKLNDIPYLGCNKDRILNSNPQLNSEVLDTLKHYISERQSIKHKRDRGEPFPWTDEEVFRVNSFTNIRREDDRVSKWLIDNIIDNPNLSLFHKIYRSILFRMYNRIDTAELLKLHEPYMFRFGEYGNIRQVFQSDPNPTRDFYTRAFKTVGLKNSLHKLYPDISTPELAYRFVSEQYLDPDDKIWDNDSTALDIFNKFKTYPGVGNFMAYQLFVDMTYISECPVSENEFVVCGPGCIAGLNMLFSDYDELTHEEAIFWLRDHSKELFGESFFEEIFSDKPEDDRNWSVMSIENCFCELSKYIYINQGRHKRPRKYVYKGI